MSILTLTEKLKARLAFDAGKAKEERFKRITESNKNIIFVDGAEYENARLQPLLSLLVECVGALDKIISHDRRLPDFTDNPQTLIAAEFLAKLEKELSK